MDTRIKYYKYFAAIFSIMKIFLRSLSLKFWLSLKHEKQHHRIVTETSVHVLNYHLELRYRGKDTSEQCEDTTPDTKRRLHSTEGSFECIRFLSALLCSLTATLCKESGKQSIYRTKHCQIFLLAKYPFM